MRGRNEHRFDLSPLGQPLWWAALALLLLNDNLLKGAGVVPGWLTGKLSDFAFLILAPTLLAALLPVALRGRRTLAVLSVTALFVATELSPGAADAVVSFAARVGLRWRLWPDVTDLLALAALPLTVRLLRRSPAARLTAAAGADVPWRYWRERVGVVFGAIACLATSAPPRALYAPFLVNRTPGAADVRITWVLAQVDCAVAVDTLARALGPSDLDDPRTISLASGQVAALDQTPLPGQSPAGQCRLDMYYRGTTVCVAAVLASGGATPVLMLAPQQWEVAASGAFISCDAAPSPSRCKPTLDPSVDPGFEAVSLVAENGQVRFAVSDHAADAKVRIAPVDLAAVTTRPSAPGGCRELRDAYHADLARAACVTNSDCDVVPVLELPGEALPDSECGSYLNRTAAADVRTLSQSFAEMCQGRPIACDEPDPPGCVNGQCAAVCIGVALPDCPPNCTHYPGVDFGEGHACNTNIVCFADDGRRCSCAAQTLTVTCATDRPASPVCPYSCRPRPWYGDAGQTGYVDRTDAATAPAPDPSAGGASDGGRSDT